MMISADSLTRRRFLSRGSAQLGLAALASLMGADARTDDREPVPGMLGRTHHRPRARNVIFLFQSGGPSHVDLFDPKPVLRDRHGMEMPASVLGNQPVTTMTRTQGHFQAACTPFRFRRHGRSGLELSDLLPAMARVADDLCIVRSMHTEPINHDPAVTFLQTGRAQPGLPCMGSWISYGLGSVLRDLPAFVVLLSGPLNQPVLARYYHSGFLPGRHQGVCFQNSGDPVPYLANPPGVSRDTRGEMIRGINDLNRVRSNLVRDPEIETRIDAFEMAFRMQRGVPDLVDVSGETRATLDLYGDQVNQPGTFARNCLLARRMVERGVRFVQLYHRGWDHHANIVHGLRRQTDAVDRPTAALIADLKRRGLLEDTLVVWGGEFGRTSFGQGDLAGGFGRDHHPRCFSYCLAGGGVRAGSTYGTTDDFGYNVAANPVHVNDLHATLLHCLGIDHERLTFRFGGRDFRLTDVGGRVVTDLLA